MTREPEPPEGQPAYVPGGFEMPARTQLSRGQIIDGRYQVVTDTPLGSGGYSPGVHLVKDLRNDEHPYALKLVGTQRHQVEAAEREVLALSDLPSKPSTWKYVSTLVKDGRDSEVPYLLFPRYEASVGECLLTSATSEAGMTDRVPPRTAFRIARDTALGVAAVGKNVEERGGKWFGHFDLSLDNILVQFNPRAYGPYREQVARSVLFDKALADDRETWTTVASDFGIAHFEGLSVPREAQMGNAVVAPPDPGAWCSYDTFSLGRVVWDLVLGQPKSVGIAHPEPSELREISRRSEGAARFVAAACIGDPATVGIEPPNRRVNPLRIPQPFLIELADNNGDYSATLGVLKDGGWNKAAKKAERLIGHLPEADAEKLWNSLIGATDDETVTQTVAHAYRTLPWTRSAPPSPELLWLAIMQIPDRLRQSRWEREQAENARRRQRRAALVAASKTILVRAGVMVLGAGAALTALLSPWTGETTRTTLTSAMAMLPGDATETDELRLADLPLPAGVSDATVSVAGFRAQDATPWLPFFGSATITIDLDDPLETATSVSVDGFDDLRVSRLAAVDGDSGRHTRLDIRQATINTSDPATLPAGTGQVQFAVQALPGTDDGLYDGTLSLHAESAIEVALRVGVDREQPDPLTDFQRGAGGFLSGVTTGHTDIETEEPTADLNAIDVTTETELSARVSSVVQTLGKDDGWASPLSLNRQIAPGDRIRLVHRLTNTGAVDADDAVTVVTSRPTGGLTSILRTRTSGSQLPYESYRTPVRLFSEQPVRFEAASPVIIGSADEFFASDGTDDHGDFGEPAEAATLDMSLSGVLADPVATPVPVGVDEARVILLELDVVADDEHPLPRATESGIDRTELAVGDCLWWSGGALDLEQAVSVGCSEPHHGEVISVFDQRSSVVGHPYEGVVQRSQRECRADRFTRWAGRPWIDSPFWVDALVPTRAEWREGERRVVCVARTTFVTLTDEPLLDTEGQD